MACCSARGMCSTSSSCRIFWGCIHFDVSGIKILVALYAKGIVLIAISVVSHYSDSVQLHPPRSFINIYIQDITILMCDKTSIIIPLLQHCEV